MKWNSLRGISVAELNEALDGLPESVTDLGEDELNQILKIIRNAYRIESVNHGGIDNIIEDIRDRKISFKPLADALSNPTTENIRVLEEQANQLKGTGSGSGLGVILLCIVVALATLVINALSYGTLTPVLFAVGSGCIVPALLGGHMMFKSHQAARGMVKISEKLKTDDNNKQTEENDDAAIRMTSKLSRSPCTP